MRLLFITNPIAVSEISEWCTGDAVDEHSYALAELYRVHVLKRITAIDSTDENQHSQLVSLNPHFRESFKTALSCPCEPWTVPGSTDIPIVPIDTIEHASREKWDTLLRMLVSLDPPSHRKTPPALASSIENFVRKSGLMAEQSATGTRKKLGISAAGYEYMLKGYHSQVWIFVLETMKVCSSLEDSVALLFMMAFCTHGRGYPLIHLSLPQRQLVYEFAQLGIIYAPGIEQGGDSVLFYPSQVAIAMLFRSAVRGTSGGSIGGKGLHKFSLPSTEPQFGNAAFGKTSTHSGTGPPPISIDDSAALNELQIIVETNHQVVAYLTSELHLALLHLFVDFQVALPNMAIGRLTRTKAKEAFKIGLRAEQIVQFLCVHAHPRTASQQPVIPLNVVDQLVLWQNEQDRLKDADALFVDFTLHPSFTKDKYSALLSTARRLEAVLWCDDSKMQAVFDPDVYESQLDDYIRDVLI